VQEVGIVVVEVTAWWEGWTDRTQRLREVHGEFMVLWQKWIGTGQGLREVALGQVGAWQDAAQCLGNGSGNVSKGQGRQACGQISSGAL
jgi:hypothetical protein